MTRPLTTTLMTSAGPAPLAPKGWQSPMRNKDGSKKDLFQLFIERTSDGRPQAVGPAMLEDQIRDFCAVVQKNIVSGRERQWSNPTVVKVT